MFGVKIICIASTCFNIYAVDVVRETTASESKGLKTTGCVIWMRHDDYVVAKGVSCKDVIETINRAAKDDVS